MADPNKEGFEDDQAYYHSERVLLEPKGMISDELKNTKKKNKSKKKSRNQKETSNSKTSCMGGRVRTFDSWKQRDMPIDIETDPNMIPIRIVQVFSLTI